MPATPPKWITFFYYGAAVAVICALALILFRHDERRPDIGARPVADLTINLSGIEIREHCTTCHPGGSRPDPEQLTHTIRQHPDISPHRVDQLGCTACHLGEGMALDLNISHGLPGLGARKVLTGNDLQATCFRCHPPAPLAGADDAWQGYRLFYSLACSSCHSVNEQNLSGRYGPDLNRVGNQLGLDQLQEAIIDPRREPANSKMPRFPISKRQARQLGYFLKSRMGTPLYATPMQMWGKKADDPGIDLVPVQKGLSVGEKKLYRWQCLGCHKFGKADGRIGPDLTYIGDLRRPEYLERFLSNPSRLIPGSAMPRITMPKQEEQALLSFLRQKAVGPVIAPGGRRLYMHLCQRCHAANGDGRGPIQPNLATMPRAFTGNADFFRSVTDERLLASLRHGIPGTSMPGFGRLLEDEQTSGLIDLVFAAFIEDERMNKTEPAALPEKPDHLATQSRVNTIFEENCARCHGRFGTGTGPDALQYLPRPRNMHNSPYFAALPDQRIARAVHDGIPGTAMPAFRDHLDAMEIWSLVEKVRSFSGEGGLQ